MAKPIKSEIIDAFHTHNINTQTRTIYLGSRPHLDEEIGVDFLLSENIIKNLHILEQADPEGNSPITLIINNPGGDVTEGLAIYDTIKACKNHVTAVGYGKVWSMAGYIMQAADVRLMLPNATFMLHEGVVGFEENHPRSVKKWIEFSDKQEKILFDIYLKAIRTKKPDFKSKDLDKLLMFDNILTAEMALEYGLIDDIQY